MISKNDVKGYEMECEIPVFVFDIAIEAKMLANCIFCNDNSFFSIPTYSLIDLKDSFFRNSLLLA